MHYQPQPQPQLPAQPAPAHAVPCAQLAAYAVGASSATVTALADSLVHSLISIGWSPGVADRSAGRVLQNGVATINADRSVGEMSIGRITGAKWAEICAAAGISQLQVTVTGLRSAAPVAPMPIMVSGRKPGYGRKALIIVGAIVALLVSGGYYWYHNASWYTNKSLAADGRSDLPGGGASMTYAPRTGDQEQAHDQNGSGGLHDGAEWRVRHESPSSFSEIGIGVYGAEPTLSAPGQKYEWVVQKNSHYSSEAGRALNFTGSIFEGLPTYEWQFVQNDGIWVRAIWSLAQGKWYSFYCVGGPGDDLAAFQTLCNQALAGRHVTNR